MKSEQKSGAKSASAKPKAKGATQQQQQQQQHNQKKQPNDDDDSEGDDDALLDNLKPCQDLQLKPTHTDRPIWVLPDGHIYLEAFSPYYHQVWP